MRQFFAEESSQNSVSMYKRKITQKTYIFTQKMGYRLSQKHYFVREGYLYLNHQTLKKIHPTGVLNQSIQSKTLAHRSVLNQLILAHWILRPFLLKLFDSSQYIYSSFSHIVVPRQNRSFYISRHFFQKRVFFLGT